MSGDNLEVKIEGISVQLIAFMKSQEKFNDRITVAIENQAEKSLKSEAMQVEVNTLQKQFYDALANITKNKDEISDLKTQMALTDNLVVKIDKIIDHFTKAIIGIFFLFICSIAAQVYQSNNNSNDELISKLTQAIENKFGGKNE